MELTQDDAGRRLAVRVGELVHVVLAENPTTGYRWHADEIAGLEPVNDTYEGQSQPRGATGTRRLTFAPRRAGSLRLRAALRRSWESTEADEFVVDLDVTDGSE